MFRLKQNHCALQIPAEQLESLVNAHRYLFSKVNETFFVYFDPDFF